MNSSTCFTPRYLAQHLNDQGADFIRVGDYDQAISTLIKALKIWEEVANADGCRCSSCSLEECILRTRLQQDTSMCHSGYDCASPSASVTDLEKNMCHDDSCLSTEESEERFIYRQPIYASPKFIEKGHSPGVVLSLIIILNLAMAYQMSAVQQQKLHQVYRRRLQKALQLYELAHQLQLEEDICSPRSTLIIANNVGEIHRAVENRSKYAMCLQHLLSTLMYIIDCRIPASSIELEDFFRNTSQLILHDNCAGAA